MTSDAPPPDCILIVDDDEDIRSLLQQYLQDNGFAVLTAAHGDAMEEVLAQANVDLMLLDIMMPGRDGIELCRTVRATSWLPIIMLTAKNTDIDRILGIEVGADDYLTKPFNPRELLARIRGVLRRARAPIPNQNQGGSSLPPEDQEGVFRFDAWRLDTNACQLYSPDDEAIPLTAGEFDLLNALLLSPGRAVTRQHLLTLTHGMVSEAYERSIDVLVSRLRQKIEVDPKAPHYIKTVRQVGYLFNAKVHKG